MAKNLLSVKSKSRTYDSVYSLEKQTHALHSPEQFIPSVQRTNLQMNHLNSFSLIVQVSQTKWPIAGATGQCLKVKPKTSLVPGAEVQYT